jgi:uncharacterized membrane-anchored protein
MQATRRIKLGLAFLLSCLLCANVVAQDKQPESAQPVNPLQAEFNAAVADAKSVMVDGPSEVKLANQALLKLPSGYRYFPGKQAGRLLRAMGNRVTQDPLGMVTPGADRNGGWFVVVEFADAGYIKDDDAKNWNADDLLKNIKSSTDTTNDERRERGIPEVEVVGWVEKPAYDEKTRRLVWSIASKEKGQPDGEDQTINYNTLALGREGYMSLNLVTALSAVEQEKSVAKELLAALEFEGGKRYEEFNSSTDKIAEYGLAALIGGIAAKKLGLLALAGAFILKFAKVIGLAVIGGLAVFTKYFKGRRKPATVEQAKEEDKPS